MNVFEKILKRLEKKLKKSEERYHRYLDNINLPCVFDKSDIEETRIDSIKEILEIVHEVAEEYNGCWIACSERLPEEPFGCLVTVIDCEPVTQTEFENILPYFVGYDGESWNDEDGNEIPFEVIAWQPLPEPFKERD